MKFTNKSNIAFAYLSFLISPIFSLGFAFQNYKQVWAKNIVWAFIAFYAYHFVPPNESSDIWGYIGRFEEYGGENYKITDFILSLYSQGSSTLDVVEPLVSYLLSQISNNYKVLLLAYGIIFGYFYSRNIWFFLDQFKGRIKIQTIFILLLFFVTIGIWNLNGFRFWCAAHIFIFGAYNFLILKKNKGVYFLLLAVLTHIGLLLPVAMVLFFRFIKKIPIQTLFIGFLFTFFFAELNLESVRNLVTNYSPGFLQGKLTAYTSEAYVEVVNQRAMRNTIFNVVSKYIRTLMVLFFIVVLYLNRERLKSINLYYLFGFTLFLGIISNFMSQMPSGVRYLNISDFLLYGTFLCFVQNNTRYTFDKLLFILLPLVLFYVIYNFRIIGMYTFSIHHFINNPIVSLFIN